MPRAGAAYDAEHRHRRQQVQSGQQSRSELHAWQGGRRRAQPEASVARYLSQLDTADRQEPTEALAAKTKHLKEKLAKLDGEMKRLEAYEKKMLASPDQQISSTDPDSRSNGNEWARLWGRRLQRASGRNVQVAVETNHHLIVTHDVTTSGSDRAQLSRVGKAAKALTIAVTSTARRSWPAKRRGSS